MIAVLSYDSNMDDSRDNKKNRFSNTMVFMEEYLNNVLNDELPFHNEEKNKLTYEVCPLWYIIKYKLPSFLSHLMFLLLLFFCLPWSFFFVFFPPGGELGQTFDLLWVLQFL